MRVGCVLMQRNEVNALEPWILYHASLFGIENLCIIDHGSTHPKVVNTLNWYKADGVRIIRLPPEADYRHKGDFVTAQLQEMEASGGYDFLFPIDCDEFLALRREDGSFTCARIEILDCLQSYQGQPEIFQIKQNLVNILGQPGLFLPLPYQKVFFSADHLGVVDHGSHTDVSGRNAASIETPLVYLHFHHKPWAQQVSAGKEKLRAFVDVNDPDALAAFRGPGWHLLLHMNEGEEAYHRVMAEALPWLVSVDGLLDLFEKLSIDPLFFERSIG